MSEGKWFSEWKLERRGFAQEQCKDSVCWNDIKESQLEGCRKEGNLAGQGDSLEGSGNNMD